MELSLLANGCVQSKLFEEGMLTVAVTGKQFVGSENRLTLQRMFCTNDSERMSDSVKEKQLLKVAIESWNSNVVMNWIASESAIAMMPVI